MLKHKCTQTKHSITKQLSNSLIPALRSAKAESYGNIKMYTYEWLSNTIISALTKGVI